MKAPNPIALTAAVLFTSVSLIAMSPNTPKAPVAEIDGVKVINLAPVEVRPSAEDKRAAALLTTASLTIANSPIARESESGASLLGAQLAMPYYSFGNTKLASISKE
ncbi:hypothetical protein [Dyella caseinilytica]|uniref:Uncharacterized protein n=1 Tax=Dyella caseinilytica TaxID=1849581 RepID=A0ABX7GXH6_9GAMM|nr:hypothetical protein [Dyella caseinilytica]QRN55112.1 hypothetical protein ISN74_07165 [Dyella caseinilytica]GFZ99440.1 hypothetical protein GCM10011408_20190 [Dyella caseinilytica]